VIEELGSPLSLAVSLDLVDLVRGRLELQREKNISCGFAERTGLSVKINCEMFQQLKLQNDIKVSCDCDYLEEGKCFI
jgi:hypothetical protein